MQAPSGAVASHLWTLKTSCAPQPQCSPEKIILVANFWPGSTTWLLLAVVFAAYASRASGPGAGTSKTAKSHAPRGYSGNKWLPSQSLIGTRS